MGYKAYVKPNINSIFDLKNDIASTIDKKIEIGFYPDIPKDEKCYILKDAKVGIEARGAYIHFILTDQDKRDVEFIISGIKNYEYDVNDTFRKYWIYVSDEILTQRSPDATRYKFQTGDKCFRFMLYIDKTV